MNYKTRGVFAWVVLFGVSLCRTLEAQEIVAVLSSESHHYQEGFQGLQEVWTHSIPVLNLSKDAPDLKKQAQVVVAFGARAVLQDYRDEVSIVACLAPGIAAPKSRRKNSFIYISMMPRANIFLAKLKVLQPSLRRLAVFWVSDSLDDYMKRMRDLSSSFRIELIDVKLSDGDALPEQLRRIKTEAEAILLLPDPILINAYNFIIIKDFSQSNRMPFYAPTAALAEQGASASISVNFKEMGRAAAQAAKKVLAGAETETSVYPEDVEIAVNLTAAQNSGLTFSPELLGKMDKVFP